MKTNLEIVTEACVKANPDIMKLEFGCEVKIIEPKGLFRYWSAKIITPCMGAGRWYCLTSSNDEHKDSLIKGFNLEDKKNSIILGRPIRLADVLRAIMNSKVTWMDMWMVAPTGSFWKQDWINRGDEGSKERAKFASEFGNMEWNLTQDDLRLQSDEVLAFLAEILK